MKRKIFKSLFSLSAISIIITTMMISFVMYNGFRKDMQFEIRQEARYIAEAINLNGQHYLSEINKITGNRITLIDEDGTVLFDNRQKIERMGNHSNRVEVAEALVGGSGEMVRKSDTLGQQTFYFAVRLEDGRVLRVANTNSNVYAATMENLPYMIGICIVMFAITVLLSRRQTAAIVAPINEMNLDEPLSNEVYDEFSPLLRKMEQQKQIIENTFLTLNREREEFNSITQNMNEGLVLLNERGEMLLVNKRASEIFGKTGEGHYLTLNRSAEFREVAEMALTGSPAESKLNQAGRLYQLMAIPTVSSSDVAEKQGGVVVLALDITEKEETEKMRREFSANVSHELKTPLTSILGYAEIIKEGIAKTEDINSFAAKIHEEAKRMISLVEDIMKISQLDEGIIGLPVTEVDLRKICSDIIERLQAKAREENVNIYIAEDNGMPITVMGVAPMLEELVFNLCDNAIKYNKAGGEVAIKLSTGPTRLEVSDTGIGITEEEQGRVFERFYRVDKSHSKETGGTGLGLSIVKHIVKQQNATIRLESQQGKGTTIEVGF